MGVGGLEVIKERARRREEYLREARKFAECVLRKLSNSTVIVYGSVARGDYNEWSDIDVLIVTSNNIPQKPMERLDLVYEYVRRGLPIEPVIVTYDEFIKLLNRKNPLIIDALERGVVLVDKLNIRHGGNESRVITEMKAQ